MSQEIDFSTVIASAVHDMKNSLGMLLNSLDELRDELPQAQQSVRFNTLQYEAQRVHGDLIQLLGLYRLQQQTLSAHIEEQFVPDFLVEQLAQHQVLMAARGLSLQSQADPIAGYFDRDLIGGVLNNILNNAIRYTRTAIRVSAREHDGYLVLSVEDDGQGYPEHMRAAPEQTRQGIDFATGSTSLGIYFAARIARLHQEGDRNGEIRLSNGGQLGGGVFEIWLP
jgi:signal transduction histidine kinase